MFPKRLRPPFLKPVPSEDQPPVVQTVAPSSDRIAGGAAVTVLGNYFRTGAVVTFDGLPATAVVVVDQFTITCNTPAHVSGIVDVIVTNANGAAGRLPASFTYVSSVIVSNSPPSGLAAGGGASAINGTNFVAGSTISFGVNPATSVVFVNATLYQCVVPAGVAGQVVSITITEPGGATFTLPNTYIYVQFVVPTGTPAPTLDQPTSPNTTAPSGSFTESQSGIRWTPTVNIRGALGNSPNTCTFTIDGLATPPVVNTDVSFSFNSILKFAGTILGIESTYEDSTQNRIYHVTAADYTWQLNRLRPRGRYDKKLPSFIVRDLVSKFAPGFSVGYVSSEIDLNGPITLRLDGLSDFATVLTEVCRNAGDTHWKVDYYKNLRVFEGQDPFLSSVTPLVDGLASPKLWNDPPVKLITDLSQIRNRVTVVGKGTSAIKNPLKLTNISGTEGYVSTVPTYDFTQLARATICVSNGDGFVSFQDAITTHPEGGYALCDGLKVKYIYLAPFISTGASFITDPAYDQQTAQGGTPNLVIDLSDSETGLNVSKLLVDIPYDAGPTTQGFKYKAFPDGMQVLPLITVDDSASIAQWGLHEFTIADSNLTTTDSLTARAKADLKKFAQPLHKLEYTSDDDKNIAGAHMRADLSSPLIHDDFVLQDVTLVHDEFGFRYLVIADTAARYELNDLILDLDKSQVQPDVTGLVVQAVKQAVAQTPTITGSTLQTASGFLSSHQVNQLNTSPVEVIPAPGVNKTLVITSAFFYSSVVAPQATTQVPLVSYSGHTAGLATAALAWNGVTNQETDNIAPFATGDGAQSTATLIENRGISIRANNNGNSDGSGTYAYAITYYVVTRPV